MSSLQISKWYQVYTNDYNCYNVTDEDARRRTVLIECSYTASLVRLINNHKPMSICEVLVFGTSADSDFLLIYRLWKWCLKIGKIVINLIPLLMYSIRVLETPFTTVRAWIDGESGFLATPIWIVGKFWYISKTSFILINTRDVGYQMKALDVRNPINALILHLLPSGCHAYRPHPFLA